MRRSIVLCLASSTVLFSSASPAAASLIDAFTTVQVVTAVEGHSAIDVADPVPANRNVGVSGSSAVGSIGGGSLSFTAPTATGYRTMAAAWFLASPLDVTDSGASTGVPLFVSELTLDTDLIVTMRACGPGPLCAAAHSFASIHLVRTGPYFIPFSTFSILPGSSAPVDFTAVTYVSVQLNPTPSSPAGNAVLAGPLQTAPEPPVSLVATAAVVALAGALTRRLV